VVARCRPDGCARALATSILANLDHRVVGTSPDIRTATFSVRCVRLLARGRLRREPKLASPYMIIG